MFRLIMMTVLSVTLTTSIVKAQVSEATLSEMWQNQQNQSDLLLAAYSHYEPFFEHALELVENNQPIPDEIKTEMIVFAVYSEPLFEEFKTQSFELDYLFANLSQWHCNLESNDFSVQKCVNVSKLIQTNMLNYDKLLMVEETINFTNLMLN